ncbi:MAG: HAD family hydrolase [Defluviitaleaceae bacterium]|nr:HAD family hydrolase [Defluviitaleaceae bacterium]
MKAVVFDLFETLITEWQKVKYLQSEVAADLGVDLQLFRQEWQKLGKQRYLGNYPKMEQVYEAILNNLGVDCESRLIFAAARKRELTKRQCFNEIEPKIIEMLMELKKRGYKIGLISNCSPEEVYGLRGCRLHSYLDAVVLSCDVGMIKPDVKIYEHCCSLLGAQAKDCFFVGDGGSDELNGARQAGMTPFQALWFIKHFVKDFDANEIYKAFYEPKELLDYLQ